MKKIISVFLTLIIVLSFSVTAFADVTYENGDTLNFDGDLNSLYSINDVDGTSFYKICSGDVLPYIIENDMKVTIRIPSDNKLITFYLSECIGDENGLLMFSEDGYSFMFFLDLSDENDAPAGFYFLSHYFIDEELIPDSFCYISRLVIPNYTGWGTVSDDNTSITDTIVIKEDRPLFETPLTDYSVTEGLLLLIFVVTVLNNIFKSHIKG